MPTTPTPIEFDGTGNTRLVMGSGTISVAGGYTLAACVRPKVAAQWQNVIEVLNAGNQDVTSIELDPSDTVRFNIDGSEQGSLGAVTANVWYLMTYAKASGVTSPRCRKYDFGLASWENIDAGATAHPTRTASQVNLGEWEVSFDQALMHWAVGGFWNSQLSDGSIDTLVTNLDAWQTLSPAAWWVANGGTAIIDETGGTADESSREAGVTTSAQTSPLQWAAVSSVPTLRAVYSGQRW